MEDAKNMLKKFAKQALKKFLFSKVGLITIAIVIVFIMILSGGIYILNLLEGVLKEGDLKNVPYGASTYTNSVTISSNGLTTEMTAQELWDTMIENGSNVKKYLKTPQELEKLMKAEIVTQNPKIGKGELDGIIEFKRRKTDKSVIDLKYVDEETFNSYIDAYNTDGDETALKYYTIDANGNALIAQWTKTTKTVEVSVDGSTPTSETTITYSMTSAMINYKSVVQKYSMPFDYLWALLITTNGKKFVLELADYVIEDSSIDITGIENYSSTPDVDGPKSETITVTEEVDVTDPKTGKKYKEKKTVNKTKTTTITTTVETNNVNADLTKADTWIMDYKKDDNGNVTSKPKVDKDSNERNFITILNKYPYTKQNLDSSALMLFEILERNTSTANMVDLTKYLLYVATGNYYGVKEYDFSEYEQNDFISAGSLGGSLSLTTPTLDKETFGEALREYANNGAPSAFKTNFLPYVDNIYDWSVAAGVNPELVIITAKSEGKFGETGGSYNYWGIGVSNGSETGNSYSSLKEGIEGYAQVIISYQTGWKKDSINDKAIKRAAVGVDPLGYGTPETLSGMQSLYSSLGEHVTGSSGTGGYYYMDPSIANVTKIYSTHAEFLTKCKNSGLSEHAYGTSVTEWENGQYTAWQVEQKLTTWEHIFGNFGSLPGSGSTEIVETAKSKLGCPYVLGAKGPDSFDCSGFVYWVYKQKGITVPGSTDEYKSYINSGKEIDWSQAQPGDILIIFNTERGTTYGHAGIYLGNDEYIHAPQTGDVVKISSGAQAKFRHVFRFN